jgi:WD40 repeat protein
VDGRRYDAFISYSHAADGQLAPALRAALQRFAKPWYRRRALHLFLDQTSLAATPELWPTIQAALDDARYFLLLASPEAAQSPWVRREVGHWLATKPPGRLFIVLTGGELVRNDASSDFDWRQTTALPQELHGRFPSSPLWVDLRWAHGAEQLSLKHPQFLAAVGDLAAPLRGQAKDDLLGEEVRQHRRTVRLAVGAIVTLIVLLVASVLGAGVAMQQRAQAESASQLALARQLAAQAESDRNGRLDTRLLLSLEADRLNPGASDAVGSLLDLLAEGAALEGFIPGLHQRVDAISFHPDGTAFATSGPDGAWVWDVATRQPLAGPLGANRAVREPVAFSPDGSVLAASWQDGVISLFDGTSFAPMGELTFEHPARFVTLAFSQDGETLAGAGAWADAEIGTSAVIALWNWRDQKLLRALDPPDDAANGEKLPVSINTLTFSPDGAMLVSGETSGRVIAWDSATGNLRAWFVPFAGQIHSVVFSPNARTVAVGGAEYRIHLFNADSWRSVGELVPPSAREMLDPPAIRDIVFSLDGFSVVAASEDGRIFRWDASSHKVLGDPLTGHGAPVLSLDFSPDGTHLVSGAANGTLAIWALAPGPRFGTTLNASHEYIFGGAVSPDGEIVAGGDTTGVIHFWNVANREPVGDDIDASFAGVSALGFSPDGRLLASGDDLGTIAISDMSSRELVHEEMTGHTDRVVAVVFLEGGSRLASASADGTVRLWDVPTGLSLAEPVMVSDISLSSMVISPDRRLLAMGTTEGVQILDTRTFGRSGDMIPGPTGGGEVTMVAFSPDGQMLAAAGAGGVVLIEVASRQAVGNLYLPQGGITEAVAFSPDGSLLVTGGGDGLIRLWDVATWQVIGQLPRGHKEFISWLFFTPDGRYLVSSDDVHDLEGSLVLWDMRLKTWMELACAITGRSLTTAEWSQYLGDLPYEPTCPDAALQGKAAASTRGAPGRA